MTARTAFDRRPLAVAPAAAPAMFPPMNRTRILGCLACFTVMCIAVAAEPSTAGADAPFSLAKLQAARPAFTTVRIPFVQEKHLAILDEPVICTGVIEMNHRLGAVRWEYTGRSVLIFRDGKLRRWGAEGKEETMGAKDPSLQSMASQMRAFLDGDWTPMQGLFTIAPEPGGATTLIFTPRTPDLAKYITRLVIHFRDDLSAPETILLVAAGDDRTEYRFEAPQAGIAIAEERFLKP
jgi:hypothetical protein